jgi:hypothetical protein
MTVCKLDQEGGIMRLLPKLFVGAVAAGYFSHCSRRCARVEVGCVWRRQPYRTRQVGSRE